MAEEDHLLELDWISVPNESYLMKYTFSETGYNIIITNLMFLYSERLADADIQKRFCNLNPFAQMKSQVILENLKKSLQKCIAEQSSLNMRFEENKLFITLKFPVAHVLCNYDIELLLMSAEKVMHYIITPTVFGALLSQRKVLNLQSSSATSKSCSTSNVTMSSKDVLEPEWLKGKNVPLETVLDSFLKIQNHFKDLCAENSEAYSQLKREKPRNIRSVQYSSPQKKCKVEESINDEPTSIKFEDPEQSIHIKEEEIAQDNSQSDADSSSAMLTQPSKNNVKKKRIFKV